MSDDAWFATLPTALRWVQHHEWRAESFWQDKNQLHHAFLQYGHSVTNTDLTRIINHVNFAVAPFLPAQQAVFEMSYVAGQFPHLSVGDVNQTLDYLEYVVCALQKDSTFKWDFDWRVSIARDMPAPLQAAGLQHLLRNQRYTTQQREGLLVQLLTRNPDMGGLQRLASAMAEAMDIDRPLRLALLLMYAKSDDFIERSTLHSLAKNAPAFSLKLSARELAAQTLPEVLPVWELLESLDVPLDQAWTLLQGVQQVSPVVIMPESLTPE